VTAGGLTSATGQELAVQVLSGGLRLVTAPLPQRASVAIAFMLGVGSRYEDITQSGISHFVEHMVFKGGGRFPTARAISEAIEGVGGVLNAATDREATVFWTRVPSEHLGLALRVLADMLLQPVLDPEEVAKERQVVLEELRMYMDNPQEYVQIIFDDVMWPDHPLGREVVGREETVRGFTADDCRTHLQRHLIPETMVVTVAGDVDPDRARDAVSAELSAWAAETHPAPARPEPSTPPTGEPLRVARKSAEQANIVVGARAPSYFDPSRHVLDILNVVLGEGMSSRLFLELRERRGLVYDVHSFVTRFADSGALCMGLACEPAQAPAALEAAIVELRRLAEHPIDADELTKAREYAKGRLLLQLEGTSALNEFAGQQELLTGTILTPAALVERLDSVTADAVQSLAGLVLRDGLRAAAVGPFRSDTRLSKALAV